MRRLEATHVPRDLEAHRPRRRERAPARGSDAPYIGLQAETSWVYVALAEEGKFWASCMFVYPDCADAFCMPSRLDADAREIASWMRDRDWHTVSGRHFWDTLIPFAASRPGRPREVDPWHHGEAGYEQRLEYHFHNLLLDCAYFLQCNTYKGWLHHMVVAKPQHQPSVPQQTAATAVPEEYVTVDVTAGEESGSPDNPPAGHEAEEAHRGASSGSADRTPRRSSASRPSDKYGEASAPGATASSATVDYSRNPDAASSADTGPSDRSRIVYVDLESDEGMDRESERPAAEPAEREQYVSVFGFRSLILDEDSDTEKTVTKSNEPGQDRSGDEQSGERSSSGSSGESVPPELIPMRVDYATGHAKLGKPGVRTPPAPVAPRFDRMTVTPSAVYERVFGRRISDFRVVIPSPNTYAPRAECALPPPPPPP